MDAANDRSVIEVTNDDQYTSYAWQGVHVLRIEGIDSTAARRRKLRLDDSISVRSIRSLSLSFPSDGFSQQRVWSPHGTLWGGVINRNGYNEYKPFMIFAWQQL